jgi:hypothetical protein
VPKPKQAENKPPKYESFLDLSKQTNVDDKLVNHIIDRLQRMETIKREIGKGPTKKEPDGAGWMGESDKVRDELKNLQYELGVSGFRFGNLTYCCELRDGRRTFSQDKCKTALLEALIPVTKRGVDVLAIINKAFEDATSYGNDFFEREFAIIGEED